MKVLSSALEIFFTKNNHAGIFVKRHVAEVADWRKVSVTSATSAICVIKNGVLIFREKGCWKQFLRTFEEVREYVRGKSVGLR